MKYATFFKIALSGLLFTCHTSAVFCQQWTGPNNTSAPIHRFGRVGFGIAAPTEQLHIRNGNLFLEDFSSSPVSARQNSTLYFGGILENNQNGMGLYYAGAGNINVRASNTSGLLFNVDNAKGKTERMRITANGNVGIGSNNPYRLLTVNGDVTLANYNTSGSGNQGNGFSGLEILGNNQVPTRRGISLDPDPSGAMNFFVNSNQGTAAFNFKDGNGGAVLMTINATSGEVGVGTVNTAGYKLAVNGFVRAKKVVVETGWSDFVFYENYTLRPLAEVEKHINEKGRLPEIPSAAEIETKGADVGELLRLHMQKIEELTLYIIAQNKRIEALENEINTSKVGSIHHPKE